MQLPSSVKPNKRRLAVPDLSSVGEVPMILGIGGGLFGTALGLLILSRLIEGMRFFLWNASTHMVGVMLTFITVYWVLRMRSLKEPLGIYGGFFGGLVALWFLNLIDILTLWNDFMSSLLVNLIGSAVLVALILFLVRLLGLAAETVVSDEKALVAMEEKKDDVIPA